MARLIGLMSPLLTSCNCHVPLSKVLDYNSNLRTVRMRRMKLRTHASNGHL